MAADLGQSQIMEDLKRLRLRLRLRLLLLRRFQENLGM